MRIQVLLGSLVQVNVTTDNEQMFSLEVTEELLEIVHTLADFVLSVKPASDMDKAMGHVIKTADEKTLLDMKGIFPKWSVGITVKQGDVLLFNGGLFQVIQEHRTQSDWLPPDVPALYKIIEAPGEIGPWRQPQGTHDAYQMGDKVTHKDKTWESTADNNVWEPGVYGWKLEDLD